MWDRIQALHDHHGEHTLETRILKITEEVGEVAEAFIGMRGLNSRKGVWRTREDLLDELADVIITAAITMTAVTDGDSSRARDHLDRRIAAVITRAGVLQGAAPSGVAPCHR